MIHPPRTRPSSRRRRRQGGNAIEFALCMPLWVGLVVSIMDLSWVFFQTTTLDAATNRGCRAGSLVDPGEFDENIGEVERVAEAAMEETMMLIPQDNGVCPQCNFDAFTRGSPPSRTLFCSATREVHPLIGMFFEGRVVTATQMARLEWQRAAAE